MLDTNLVSAFDRDHGRYRELCARMQTLLQQLLRERSITVHSISSRVKARDSLLRKIAKKGAAYRSLEDVTDLAGVRVITFFADQVDSIAQLINDEFSVDTDNSVDKRALLDPDR